MAAGASSRALEWLFTLYFFTHIPITLLLDLQGLLGAGFYPHQLRQCLSWYAAAFKDPWILDPPVWFKAFLFCEALLQLPFFPLATYAFWKGNCQWIRIPAIIYATHVATSLTPILGSVLLGDFSGSRHPGPETWQERLKLFAVYVPYLLIPLLILFTMLSHPSYNPTEKRKKK